ncbi:MAG: NAD-dependent epimerase/dehydratase family protein [Mycobacteriales bacterium]
MWHTVAFIVGAGAPLVFCIDPARPLPRRRPPRVVHRVRHRRRTEDEHAPLRPRGFFGATKAAGSVLLTAAAAERAVRSVVLRAFQVYGPGDHPGRFVPAVLSTARDGTVLPLTGPGRRRDWVYVPDVVDACVRAATADHLPAGQVLTSAPGCRPPTRSWSPSSSG